MNVEVEINWKNVNEYHNEEWKFQFLLCNGFWKQDNEEGILGYQSYFRQFFIHESWSMQRFVSVPVIHHGVTKLCISRRGRSSKSAREHKMFRDCDHFSSKLRPLLCKARKRRVRAHNRSFVPRARVTRALSRIDHRAFYNAPALGWLEYFISSSRPSSFLF